MDRQLDLRLVASFVIVALLGIVLQYIIFRWMEGQDLRQTLVTIGSRSSSPT